MSIDPSGIEYGKLDSDLINFIIKSLAGIFNGEGAVDYIDLVRDSYGNATEILLRITVLANYILPIGLLLLALRWAASLLTEIINDHFDLETFIRGFIKLVVGALLVSNSLQLLSGVLEFSTTLLDDLVAANTVTTLSFFDSVTDLLLATFGTIFSYAQIASGFFGIAFAFIIATTIFVIIFLPYFFLYLYSIMRAIRLAQLYVMAPIGMSDFYEGGLNSGAVKYVRKFLAVSMEPIIVFAAVVLFALLRDNIIVFLGKGDPANGVPITVPTLYSILFNFVGFFTIIGFIRKARTISERIFC